jgi:hypothetical protein
VPYFSVADKWRIGPLVKDFPDTFRKALVDWERFVAGMNKGLFSVEDADRIIEWFYDFPKLWEAVKPNYELDVKFTLQVEDFIKDLQGHPFRTWRGVGLAPVLIAGVLIVGGLAAGIWAVGYLKKQANVSRIIEATTTGKVPPGVLEQAVKADTGTGLFGGVADLIKWVAVGGAVLMVLPLLGVRRK